MSDYTNIFYTVPMRTQELIRDSDYKKVGPKGEKIQFDGDWREHITTRNTKTTPLLGAIANKDFIGIDIDNNPLMDQLYLLAKGHCNYVAVSLPIEANKGGHLLFRYSEEAAKILGFFTKSLKDIKIDIQTGAKLIFLATEANKTKKLITPPLTALEELTEIPPQLLQALIALAIPQKVIQDKATRLIGSLDSVAELPETTFGYMLTTTLTPSIVGELTPRLDYPNITTMDDIPRGSATDWLLKVRKKLQVDKSVSPEAFVKTIRYLVSLWSVPRGPTQQVELDLTRDLKSITWVYNKEWNTQGFNYPTTRGHAVEVYFDDVASLPIKHNTNTDEVDMFPGIAALINSIISTHKARKKFTGEQILKKAKTVKVIDTPERAPRLTDNAPLNPFFNIYTPCRGVRLLQGLEELKEYIPPTHILRFLENLLPEEENRVRFMRFLAHKHKTYEHSPLYFVLAGVGGAGKGVLVNVILRFFTGHNRLQQADLGSLANNFNSWMTTTDWLEIEEAGEGYTVRENQKLVGILKKLTGNKYLAIEKKGKDRDESNRHYMSPIISTNMDTKLITDTISNDRRLVLFRCPNKMAEITDDTRGYIAQMQQELPSFAIYLKGLQQMDYNDYTDNKNWKGKNYEEYVYATTSVVDKLYEAAEIRDLDMFIYELTEAAVSYKDIDEMFSISHGTNTSCLLYNTASSLMLGIASLEDIATKNSNLDSHIKAVFKRIKQRKDSPNNRGVKLNVLQFDGIYTQLSAPVVEPLDPNDLIISTEIDLD